MSVIVVMIRRVLAVIAVALVAGPHATRAADVLRITIPRHSELTPVQRLNREGVEAVKKKQYEKAANLFYKAYLFDPADPFTLNNLGYISELQGELDRAHKFYTLSAEQGCTANIDRSNAKQLEGKSMQHAFESLQDTPMRVNRMNVDAMSLLSKSRGFEAVALLRKALSLDAHNPFSLNNLGVADEAIGDYNGALTSFAAAAEAHSLEPVVVTRDRTWRGKAVSVMAAANVLRLQKRMKTMNTDEVNAVMLTMRGVSATNQNEWLAARRDFLRAYSLDPSGAFSLNNRGYVAEMDGDLETAQVFYERARSADGANERVGLATQVSAEGKKLSRVATTSNQRVGNKLDEYSQERRRQTGPIELTPRGNGRSEAPSGTSVKPTSSDLPPLR